ncbi:hypothetical protein MKS88_004586 [Plasmodium brasilianum]|uniref:Uncharacterized protein n=2 Tax=Plasmodium (Plasmodium) TaxID=418103 RepID=A0A1A8WAL4_PLAMA|nr:conserved Plasmodium protein, unknown function [Plasmodium malariae]KAI4836782.1 hypothetical protein MKS88_004586 [Plasmodium brasilianum]SBS88764.1 conserved Plasmodium protein, unknown function [Plasmodium malariae]SCO94075.1 conserved Plasmodium protein, unknown function [Plasmodium malariae]
MNKEEENNLPTDKKLSNTKMLTENNHVEKVPENLVCLICYDDIDENTYIEYQTHEFGEWHPSMFCMNCTGILIETQYHKYINNVQKSECLREQKNLLEMGPPINIKDKNGFPLSDGKEIYSLWYFCDKKVHSAKLDGSLVGEERMKMWDELKKFLITEEKAD